jgi:hypothetical protein
MQKKNRYSRLPPVSGELPARSVPYNGRLLRRDHLAVRRQPSPRDRPGRRRHRRQVVAHPDVPARVVPPGVVRRGRGRRRRRVLVLVLVEAVRVQQVVARAAGVARRAAHVARHAAAAAAAAAVRRVLVQVLRRSVQGAEVRRATHALHPEAEDGGRLRAVHGVGARRVARGDGAVRLGRERRAPVRRDGHGGHVGLRLEVVVLVVVLVVMLRVEARQAGLAGGRGGRQERRGGLRREDVDAEARGRGRRPLGLEAVVLLQHVDQVLVAGDGDEHVEVLGEGEELVLDGRHFRLEHLLDLLLHLCTRRGKRKN